ncbi:MAG TPA: Lar family restriction alleviation protein [Bacillota bacterium]|nr:Lar family restriction alleviation protein [Bacillota bacterium]
MSYISERDKFAPCPLCGSRDHLLVTPEYSYASALVEHGSACIYVECGRCNLHLFNHDDNIIKYSDKVRALAQVWNRFAAFQPDTLGDKEQAEDEAI